MFSWILIAFVIAVIFGVIKLDELKEIATKWLPRLKELFNQAKQHLETKSSELKSDDTCSDLSDKQDTNK